MNRLLVCAALLWVCAVSAGLSAQATPGAAAHRLSSRALSLFTTSDDCVACHNGLKTADGEDVSIGSSWRSTMMGNSARDPYFLAGLRRETIDHPSLAAAIENECAGCHAPMLTRAAHADGREARLLGVNHPLAQDSVSCSVCHQIGAEGLGSRDSFNGGFTLAAPAPGPRRMFGPYAPDQGRARIMRSVTGYAQTEARHVQDSALCATCHTLSTLAHDASGRVVGGLPEQMNFQEWQHSAFSAEQRSCQSCHMPQVSTPTRIASVLGVPREGFSRHLFVGGNFLVLRMLDRYRADLGLEASPAEFASTIAATVRQLQSETATVTVNVARETAQVVAQVAVRNLTGHKFPTGYPSRRAWLHVTARDARGAVLFESGAVREDGSIAGNGNDADAALFEPHYAEIRAADQVQVYEAILGAPGDAVTTGLLKATRYLKDNRLLPRGFEKGTAPSEVAVHGDALADADFAGEGDRVRYILPAGTVAVDVELRYQPIAFRWAENLKAYDAPEPKRFVGYFQSMSAESSVVVARAAAAVQ